MTNKVKSKSKARSEAAKKNYRERNAEKRNDARTMTDAEYEAKYPPRKRWQGKLLDSQDKLAESMRKGMRSLEDYYREHPETRPKTHIDW